jgi:hypothetical protein
MFCSKNYDDVSLLHHFTDRNSGSGTDLMSRIKFAVYFNETAEQKHDDRRNT